MWRSSAAYGGCPKMKKQAHINSLMVNEGFLCLQAKNNILTQLMDKILMAFTIL